VDSKLGEKNIFGLCKKAENLITICGAVYVEYVKALMFHKSMGLHDPLQR
jgi:hypothetical protein